MESKNINTRDIIASYLRIQIEKRLKYECMPENESGYYHISNDDLYKIVDGLIPLVKRRTNKKQFKQ